MVNHFKLTVGKSGAYPDEGEILIAHLLDAGFDSFEEDDNEIRAYIPENQLPENIPDIIGSFPGNDNHPYKYSLESFAEKNWNEIWEKSYSPIEVSNKILVKTSFHTVPDLEYTVVIEPKMSFGTGHHETTRLMLREMLELEIAGKEVLDMGCGTGVLAITAKLMGASYVLAVDVDQWAYYNCAENFEKNNISQPYDIFPGDSSCLEGHTFHIILANINRNIILADLPAYKTALKEHGIIVLSGILNEDREEVLQKTKELGFTFVSSFNENNWISLKLRK